MYLNHESQLIRPDRPTYRRAIKSPVTSIKYNTCDKLLEIKRIATGHGKWYGIYSDGIPTRYVQLSGEHAIDKFVRNYGYIDGKGCVNHSEKVLQYGETQVHDHNFKVEKLHRDVNGVPQRVYNSGLCWYSALCFVLFFSDAMRTFILKYLPVDLHPLAKQTLFKADAAEQLRREFYSRFAFGDKPDQSPELDGQNGMGQFYILAAKLNIPLVRLLAPSLTEMTESIKDQNGKYHNIRATPHLGESGMLVVRCFRTKWVPMRRITWNKKLYRLVAILIGSEECGHQIGVSTRFNCNITKWALADSDASQHGIGPLFWDIPRHRGETRVQYKTRWIHSWDKLVPVTMFGSKREKFCTLSPNNSTHLTTPTYSNSTNTPPGLVNPDYIYLHIPDQHCD